MSTKGKFKTSKRNAKGKAKLFFAFACTLVLAITVVAKGNSPKAIGYIYDSGDTVWEMAKRHCPENMEIQEFVKEIEKANDIKNSTVYKNWVYKIPVYETESEYLDMDTVVGYEVSDDGLMLLTNDGHGYFIEK